MPLTIVILAAGLGTRMKSKQAKVLHRAGGLTLVEHVVRTAKALNPDRVITVIGHQADKVRVVLQPYGVDFALQTEQKGTGHALASCREQAAGDGLLMVLYGDCPLLRAETLRQFLDQHKASGRAASVITTDLDDPTGYGRILLDGEGQVAAIVEQKAATPEQLAIRTINSGIYCFDAELLWRHIGEIEPNNPAREYYLTDIVEIFRRAGHSVAPFDVPDENELLGINTRVELAQVDRIFRDRKVRQLMLDGVTIERPETVTIDPDVTVGPDSVIGPFAQLLGTTAIGENCRVGACSIVENSQLADTVEIAAFTIVADSRIETGARVGPYARLRMHNHVEAGVQIGNFVELKKTHMGAGAKAQHLAYLGDSEIGSKSNIGAGTITCNYDGVHKHKTHIGKGAFIGSNSTLVAPVTIGDGSYVGAASVITKEVPDDSLAIGRAHQVVKEGWAAARRAKTEQEKH